MKKNAPIYEQLLERARSFNANKAARPSASVVPWRRNGSGEIEVYWVHRSPALRFMGGWHAFPGGGLSRKDQEIEIDGLPIGLTVDQLTDPEPILDQARREQIGLDLVPGMLVCAARELFEEAGLLLTASCLATSLSNDRRQELRTLRQHLLNNKLEFAKLLADHDLRLDAQDLVFAGRWLTPPFAPMRFDNRFFLLEWPQERALQPEILVGELDHGEWIEPQRAYDRWREGEVITAPPILHLLKTLAEDGPEQGLTRLRQPEEANLGPMRRIEFRPGVVMLPLLTPTLPPATHTNAFLLGHDELVLIDPATPLEGEQQSLIQALDAVLARGHRIRAIWLTHHHADHIGAVEAVRQHLNVPVLCHPHSKDHLAARGITVDGELQDGKRIVLEGDIPFPVRVHHTPGHTRGHLCFHDETYGSLIAGDLVSSLSTIVIDPPEGDMNAYLTSLERMSQLRPSTIFPAHGPPILKAVEHLEHVHSHRLEREAMILAAWRDGLHDSAAIVTRIYADVPEVMHPVAERQVLAHLERLRQLDELRPDEKS